jgi:hypothetical protein
MEPIDNTQDGAPIYVAISYKQFYAPNRRFMGSIPSETNSTPGLS